MEHFSYGFTYTRSSDCLLTGLSNCCFLYGTIGLLNCFLGILTIPDNRGKSLVKVEEMYEKKKICENPTEIMKVTSDMYKDQGYENPVEVSDGKW